MTHVLIVDDERSIHKSYRADILSAPERYTLVDTIVSAADALMVCGAKHIDLILMDINTAKNESGIEAKVGCSNKTELLVMVMQSKLVLPRKQEN